MTIGRFNYEPVGSNPNREYRQTILYHARRGPTIVPTESFYQVFDAIQQINEKIFVEFIASSDYVKVCGVSKESK